MWLSGLQWGHVCVKTRQWLTDTYVNIWNKLLSNFRCAGWGTKIEDAPRLGQFEKILFNTMGKILTVGKYRRGCHWLPTNLSPPSSLLRKLWSLVKQHALAKTKTKQRAQFPDFLTTYVRKLKALEYHTNGINVYHTRFVQALNETMHVKWFIQPLAQRSMNVSYFCWYGCYY